LHLLRQLDKQFDVCAADIDSIMTLLTKLKHFDAAAELPFEVGMNIVEQMYEILSGKLVNFQNTWSEGPY